MAIFLTILVALLAALGGIYQFLVSPVLQNLGAFRKIGPNTGTRHCITVPELSACEGEPQIRFQSTCFRYI